MNLPDYVSKIEVSRICKELSFRDWSQLKKISVMQKEAKTILQIVNVKGMDIPLEDFRQGLEVELEHGILYDDANVTNNHPILTGMIVLAHLKETTDYYKRLEVVEIEADLLQAVLLKDQLRIESKYRKLIQAKFLLDKTVSNRLSEGNNV